MLSTLRLRNSPGVAIAPLTVALCCACRLAVAQDAEFDRLQHLQTVTRNDLTAASNLNFDPEGKHLYAAAWQAGTVALFEPDPITGLLTHAQSISDPETLNGVTTIRLSSDGRYAVAAAFRARNVVLFERDPLSGKLTILDVVRGSERPELGLAWPIDAEFSPDGRFVYVCDPKQSGAAANAPRQEGSILVFEVTRLGKLDLVDIDQGEDNCFFGCRGIEFGPDGRVGYAACTNSSQIVVVDRDATTGKITVRQVITDDRDAPALEGVIGILCSPDGRFVYASSGRFSGDDSVTVFRVKADGTLALEQSLIRQTDLHGFLGGNELTLSPDGSELYVTATRSGSLARFRRDPESGRLSLLELLHHGRLAANLAGAADAAVSRDGRVVYVAAENGGSISVFAADSSPDTEPAASPDRQTAEP